MVSLAKTDEKLFEIILENWIRNLKKVWKSQPEAHPAIKSHGKFWLSFVNFSEEIRYSFHVLERSHLDQMFDVRDLTIRAFFESPIFEITKKEIKNW